MVFEADIEDYRTYKDDEDFRHTQIHEFGHILRFNDSQVEPTELKWQEVDSYTTNEGLTKSLSYIQTYTEAFWKEGLLNQWDRIQRINNDYKKYDATIKLYESNDILPKALDSYRPNGRLMKFLKRNIFGNRYF